MSMRAIIAKTICTRAILVALAVLAGSGAAHAQVVLPAEQAARDSDRLRILQDELAKEQAAAAALAKRRADRLAARDAHGAQEAEAAQQRSSANLAALRREIELASKTAKGTAAAPAATVTATRRPAPVLSVGAAQAPWWDVYSKAPRRGGAEPVAHRVSVAGEPAAVGAERAR